jgi:site-specific recombinase XerD
LSELANLRLGDIGRTMRVLLIHRKGNKWQQVPVSRDGFKPLHEYLTRHRSYLAKLADVDTARKEDAAFLADDGKPLTHWGVSMLFRRLKRRTGIDGKRVSAHNCRRYMATTQLASGRSPLDVRRQLGHTTLKMIDHYASLTIQQLKKSHEQHSPLRINNNSGDVFGTGYWEE